MDTYEELLCWAAERGVEITGIKPQTTTGRGTRIIATRDIEVPHLNISLNSSLTMVGRGNHSRSPVQNFSVPKPSPKGHFTKTATTYFTPRPSRRTSYFRRNKVLRRTKQSFTRFQFIRD